MIGTMKIEPFTAELKDGREVEIREARIQDASELMQCIKAYMADGNFQVMEQDEFDHYMYKAREWVNAFIEEEHSILLVAEHNGQIIGNIDITGASRKRLKHNGLIGMGMLQQFRQQGLGSILLETAISWAKDHTQLERLWLQIIDGNNPAIQLYHKFGFVEEGRQKHFIKTASGYADNLIMALMLQV
jgi:RimJ/RimL family protein N-acetyltransferase